MGKTNKCKVINKPGRCQFVMQSLKGQQRDENALFAINSRKVKGMIAVEVIKKGSGFELVYNLAGFVTLKEFLINPLSRDTFGKLLQNILEVFQDMQRAGLNQACLIMDFDKVLINTMTQELKFIYIPIQGFNSGGTLRAFLSEMIAIGSFVSAEDSGYVTEYIKILNTGLNFSVFELEEYIRGLTSEQGYRAVKYRKCPKCKAEIENGVNFCPVCGNKISENHMKNGDNGIYDPLAAETGKAKTESGISGTQGLSDRELMAAEEFDGTTVLGMETFAKSERVYLVRIKTEEKIWIDKQIFHLGKSRQGCDYMIADNKAVSRQHADIVMQDNRYFIVDLNSTNKTYADGGLVTGRREITSGTKIRLADEEFVFYVE